MQSCQTGAWCVVIPFPLLTKEIPCLQDGICRSDVPSLLSSSAAAVFAVCVVSVRVQAGDVEEIWVRHFALAAGSGAKVEVECRAG